MPPSGGGALDAEQVELEAKVRASYQDCRIAYIEWCEQFGKKADSLRFATFSSNYLAMREYAKKSGKELRLNAYADCTKEEYARILNRPIPSEQDQLKRAMETRLATQSTAQTTKAPVVLDQPAPKQDDKNRMAPSFQGRREGINGAQVGDSQDMLDKSSRSLQEPPPKPTQVVKTDEPSDRTIPTNVAPDKSNTNVAVTRPTEVIKRSDEPPARPTQVIVKAEQPALGTQVIQRAEVQPPSRPTEVIKRADDSPGRPTEVIKRVDGKSSRRTLLIDENEPQTISVDKVQGSSSEFPGSFRPTIVIDKNSLSADPSKGTEDPEEMSGEISGLDDRGPAPRGTYVIRKGSESPLRGTFVVRKGTPEFAPRGTIVIKNNAMPDGAGSPARGTFVVSKGAAESVAPRGTIVIKNSVLPDRPAFKFPFFGTASDTADALGARGTIVVKRVIPDEQDEKSLGINLFPLPRREPISDTKIRGTEVIRRIEQDQDSSPSIFSFFGGNKKTDNSRRVRGTIVLQKRQGEKRIISPQKATVLIPKSEVGGVIPSIFSFFGGAKIGSLESRGSAGSPRPTIVINKQANDFMLPFSFFSSSKGEKSSETSESVSSCRLSNNILAALTRLNE